jgi:hypothetical protein
MEVDGGCHCGKICYEAEVDPGKAVICHGTDCQTLSGSAFRTVVPSNEGSFRLLSGTPTVYVKTAESGRRRVQTFCAECETPIYSARRWRYQDRRPPPRRDPAARPADPERSILGALMAAVAAAPAEHKDEGKAAKLRPQRRAR